MEEEASLNSFCSILETSHSFAVNLISFHNAPSFSNSEMVFPFKDWFILKSLAEYFGRIWSYLEHSSHSPNLKNFPSVISKNFLNIS